MKTVDEVVEALMANKRLLSGPEDKYRLGRINALEWVLGKPETDIVEGDKKR